MAIILYLFSSFACASPFQNLTEIISDLHFPRSVNKSGNKVKIAILDNSFYGYQEEIDSTLPKATFYHEGPIHEVENKDLHGLRMAQLVSALVTNDFQNRSFSFELHLYPTFGYTNFASAVESIIENKIDVVLYAQVWEYGGNYDGHGFINSTVDRAVKAGALWINAAGNFGRDTFNKRITIGEDKWVNLPDTNNSVHVRCLSNKQNKCQMRVVLSWNDFKNDVNQGTTKDLDLILFDDTLNIVQTSALVQKEQFPEGEAGFSKYPREIIETAVRPGLYLIRVKARSDNFTSRDSLRITTSGENVELQLYDSAESLLNPADNTGVITVGASDSERSSISQSLNKPEIVAPSLIVLSSKEKYKGSSQAAAIVAAGAVILKSVYPTLTKEKLLQLTRLEGEDEQVGSHGLPLQALQFTYTGPGCFYPTQLSLIPQTLENIVKDGAVPVITSAGTKVFTFDDPLIHVAIFRRNHDDDVVLAGPSEITLWPRSLQSQIPKGSYEMVQIPLGQKICDRANRPTQPKSFVMPDLPNF